jgi:hypothetical protein
MFQRAARCGSSREEVLALAREVIARQLAVPARV